jgi:hypothetical protein
VLVDRLHEERDGLKCEMTVSTSTAPVAGLLREGNFNLSSTTTRTQWQKALAERLDIDWYAILEQVCTMTRRRWREGEPVVDLTNVKPRSGMPYLLPPFIVDGAASILFAEGGTGKSMLALAMGVSVAACEPLLDSFPTRPGPVLYLDWEWDAESHAERLQAICRGAGISPPKGMIHYRHEMASVWESASVIRRRVAELGAVLVIIDSLGFARGGEPESADLTLKTFAALRTLGVPVLVLDHVAKNATDKKFSFGSIYTTNAARLTWRADAIKEEGKNRITIGLSNQKANGRFHKPVGIVMDMETDEEDKLMSVRFTPTDPADVPGLTKSLALRDQIAGVIRASSYPIAIAGIATALAAEGSTVSQDVIRAIVNRNKEMFVKVGDKWAMNARVGA